MSFYLGNPAGLWALLGIPAILCIHLIQQRTRRVKVSTLFLLENMAPLSVSGRRLDRLRSSLPLWLQLASVCVITWILADPRWSRPGSWQRYVIVLDDSFSMAAFRPRLADALLPLLRSAAREAETTEWLLIGTDLSREPIYDGRKLADLEAALAEWRPSLPSHDPTPALDSARRSRGRAGRLLYVTDHRPAQMPDLLVLGIGDPISNAGFVGASFDSDAAAFDILIRNYGSVEAKRSWRLESKGGSSAPSEITIPAGGLATLRVPLPHAFDSALLRLDGDGFTLDDLLPLVRPKPKRLGLHVDPGFTHAGLAKRLLASLEGVMRVDDQAAADLILSPGAPPQGRAAIVAKPTASGVRARRLERVTPAPGTIAHGLSWEGLLAAAEAAPLPSGAEAVLWQGQRPLAWREGRSGEERLVLNFDLASSNAERFPAFVIMIHRFVESIRLSLPIYEARNVELAEPLRLAVSSGEVEIARTAAESGRYERSSLDARRARFLRAPPEPSFVQASWQGKPLVSIASGFADAGEADFSASSSFEPDVSAAQGGGPAHSEIDTWRSLWLLALGLLIAWSWISDQALPRGERA